MEQDEIFWPSNMFGGNHALQYSSPAQYHLYGETWGWQHHAAGVFFCRWDRDIGQGWEKASWGTEMLDLNKKWSRALRTSHWKFTFQDSNPINITKTTQVSQRQPCELNRVFHPWYKPNQTSQPDLKLTFHWQPPSNPTELNITRQRRLKKGVKNKRVWKPSDCTAYNNCENELVVKCS